MTNGESLEQQKPLMGEYSRNTGRGLSWQERFAVVPDLPKESKISIVEGFRHLVCDSEQARKALAAGGLTTEQLALNARCLLGAVQNIEAYKKSYGPSLVKAHYEYVHACSKWLAWKSENLRLKQLQRQLRLSQASHTDPLAQASLNRLSRQAAETRISQQQFVQEASQALTYLPPDEQNVLLDQVKQITSELAATEKPLTITNPALLQEEITSLREKLTKEWQISFPFFDYMHKKETRQELVTAYYQNEEVLPLPSTKAYLDKLDEKVFSHDDILAAWLVGEPGVGKTTLIEHYVRKVLHQQVVSLDFSKELTWYHLYGTKELTLGSPEALDLQQFISLIENATDEQITQIVNQGVDKYGPAFLGLEIVPDSETTSEMGGRIAEIKNKLKAVFQQRLGAVTADKLYKYTTNPDNKNGWRDGILIDALRKDYSIIINEPNKASDLTLIHELLTVTPEPDDVKAGSVPGTNEQDVRASHPGWFWFAGTNEWIRVKHSRIYFTSNVGSRHRVLEATPAIASRAQGKVIEMQLPPKQEQLELMNVLLSDRSGMCQASSEDMQKLVVLIGTVFPGIHNANKTKETYIPYSLRTIRALAEELFNRKNQTLTGASLEKALHEVMVATYSLYEDHTCPKNIIQALIAAGYFLNPPESLKQRILGYISETDYNTWITAQTQPQPTPTLTPPTST